MSASVIVPLYFRRLITAFLRLVYPAYCFLCDQNLGIDEKHICALCRQRFEYVKEPACRTCAKPFPPFHTTTRRCSVCHKQKISIDSGYASLIYTDAAKTLIHEAKFARKFWLLDGIFDSLAGRTPVIRNLETYDFIVPVPLDQHRMKSRGFNQSLHIAKALAGKEHSRKIKDIIRKIKHTEAQSELHKSDRLHNLSEVFRLRRNVSVVNRSVLVVDDVVTTGTTVNECARLLKANGAVRVDFYALARAVN